MKPHILDLSNDELAKFVSDGGFPKFRTQQILSWMFDHKVVQPENMKNIPKNLTEALNDSFDTKMLEITQRSDSKDGASKLLLKTAAGQYIESVILRYDGRTSLCVSSQVGCKLACGFCQTGKLGFVRNLSTAEILSQFLMANEIVSKEDRKITHVVFMGMGEPLLNEKSIHLTLERLVGKETGFGLKWKNVTVSTSGIAPAISRLAELPVKSQLAISLHAANNELRTDLMPINRKYPLETLRESLVDFHEKTGQTITIEYILIKDLNHQKKHGKELANFLKGIPAKINLIAFNKHPGLPYERPDEESMATFKERMIRHGFTTTLRISLGLESSAACGQLAAKTQDQLTEKPKRLSLFSS